jgi:hypothetical protein
MRPVITIRSVVPQHGSEGRGGLWASRGQRGQFVPGACDVEVAVGAREFEEWFVEYAVPFVDDFVADVSGYRDRLWRLLRDQ